MYLFVERCHLGAVAPWVQDVRIAVEATVLPEATVSRSDAAQLHVINTECDEI